MKKIRLYSPAKLNLFLKVTGKRPDGYHNLVTIFERINLCDEISFALNPKGEIRISCSHPDVPTDTTNIVYKAAQLLKTKHRVVQGVDIVIKKRIPVAAGLGGGSSNGATALMGLNRLWKLSLSKRQLLSYARVLGSDVAFFLHDCRWGLGTQRGDRVKALKIAAKLWHILVVPEIKVYSRQVFEAFNFRLTKKNDGVNILARALRNHDVPAIGSLLLNDLETTIVRLYPNLITVKNKLRELPTQGVAFSGSGPALFGLTKSQAQAKAIKTALAGHYARVFVVATF